jgi:hypothetical protein
MTIKRLFIILFVLLFGFSAFIFLRGPNVLPDGGKLKLESPGDPVSTLDKVSRVKLHPLALDWKTIEAAENQRVYTWEEWVQRTVEIGLAEDVLYGFINTHEELVAAREKQLAIYMRWAARCKADGSILPNYPFGVPKIPDDKMDPTYRGPQTSAALIEEFDQSFLERYPQSVDWDAHYPRAAWLRKVISSGVEIQSGGDYGYYLKLRRDLINLKENPGKWQSGGFGIPPTSNFEEYETAYLNRKIWENDIRKEVRAAYPNEPQITTFFPSSQPDKYMPVVGRMTYVYRKPNSSAMRTYGTLLTREQKADLRDKGIEPDDIEIIYIDDEYNVLTENPEPYNHQEWLEKNTYDIVPEGLRTYDGTLLSPESYEEIKGEPMSAEIRQRYNEQVGAESSVDPDAARREAAREAAAAAQETAKVEFEKFQNSMRQLEEFATMSDAEIEKSLENQFRQKFLPQHPLEQLEHFTPERLEKALGTLFQHGFDEGFRRISRDSPALAEQLKQYFGQGQKPPAGKLPKGSVPLAPPAPPEAAPPESDTD